MRNSGFTNSSKQRGLTMIETLIAIVLGIVVTVGVFMVVRSATAANNAQRETDRVMVIKSAIKGIFPSPNYTGLTNTLLNQAGKVPQAMRGADDTEIKNVWASDVVVVALAADPSLFTITENNVPTDECTSMLGSLSSNFREVEAGGVTVKSPTLAYSAANAVTGCNNNGAGTTTVVLTDG